VSREVSPRVQRLFTLTTTSVAVGLLYSPVLHDAAGLGIEAAVQYRPRLDEHHASAQYSVDLSARLAAHHNLCPDLPRGC
jgi:hypothetical protein